MAKNLLEYNPVERCWGILEKRWNGVKLVDVQTMLAWAKSITWKGIHPIVELSRQVYEQGISLSKTYMLGIKIPLLCLCLVLAVQPAFAGFDEAAAAFETGDYDKALAEVRPLAEQGDPRGQYAMGVLYENGFAVAKDLPQAAAWYLKAAEQGNSDAQYNLGAMNEHGVGIPVNYHEAARWYRPAAEQGDIDALSNLGVLYQNGQGVPQDKVLAMALYNVSVVYAAGGKTQAAQNRQGLANQMPLDHVKKAQALTGELLEPGNLKPGLDAYLKKSQH